jgi:hypothetical protein
MSAAPRSSRHSLSPHPATRQSAVGELVVDLSRQEDRLLLSYRLAADVSALLVPAPAPPVRADGLWRHTCFEAFIAPAESSEYWEYNLSPSGAWAAYHFTACRTGMTPLQQGAAPAIAVEAGASQFTLAATLDLGWLAQSRGFAGLRLGLTAVIEERAHGLSYWAIQHVAEKPDFHRAESFVVALA